MTSAESTLRDNVQEYWRKGYTVVSGLYTAKQISEYQSECEHLWQRRGLDDDLNLRTEFRLDSNNEYVFDRLDPVIDISPALTEAVTADPLLDVLDAIFGNPPTLLKCKLIRKDPGTNGYAPHQDFLYWKWLDIPPDDLCSVAISLYDTDETSGGIGFYPSLHQALLNGPLDDPEGDFDVSLIDTSQKEVPLLRAGDALIFHSLAPHFSGANFGQSPRTIILPSYCANANPDLYEKYYKREITRRCRDLVGFERYFARVSDFQRTLAGYATRRDVKHA